MPLVLFYIPQKLMFARGVHEPVARNGLTSFISDLRMYPTDLLARY